MSLHSRQCLVQIFTHMLCSNNLRMDIHVEPGRRSSQCDSSFADANVNVSQ